MHRRDSVVRLLVGLIMVLTMLGVTAPVTAQANSTVTIHKRDCPTSYSGDAFYEDCHDNPGTDVTFTLGNLTANTGANGNVVFRNIAAGRYFVSEDVPGEFVETNIYCSEEADGRDPVAFSRVTGGIQLQVPASTNVVCDWYNTPYNLRGSPPPGDDDGQGGDTTPSASILIRKASCPAEVAPENRYDACFGNAQRGVTFTLAGITTTTGPDGDALFYQLQPGTYTIRESLPGGFTDFAVVCTNTDTNEQIQLTRVSSGIRLSVPQDSEIICDWYDIRESDDGQPGNPNAGRITVHKLRCPAGYDGDAFYQDCHDRRFQGVDFRALGPEGYQREVTTDVDGVIVFDGITTSGTVNLAEALPQNVASFSVYCSDQQGNRVSSDRAETAYGPGVRLYVDTGDRIVCDWYNVPRDTGGNDGVDQGYQLPIIALRCEQNPGQVDPRGFEIDGLPQGCQYASGIQITTIIRNGVVSSEQCTTGASGRCSVPVDVGDTVTVIENYATAQPIYIPRDMTLELTIESQTDPVALFVNLPVGVD